MIFANEHQGEFARHVNSLNTCLYTYLDISTDQLYFHRERMSIAHVSVQPLVRCYDASSGPAHACCSGRNGDTHAAVSHDGFVHVVVGGPPPPSLWARHDLIIAC